MGGQPAPARGVCCLHSSTGHWKRGLESSRGRVLMPQIRGGHLSPGQGPLVGRGRGVIPEWGKPTPPPLFLRGCGRGRMWVLVRIPPSEVKQRSDRSGSLVPSVQSH